MKNTYEKVKLSYNQVLLLIIVLRLILGLTYMPVVHVSKGNQDTWIILLLSIIYKIIFNFPLIYLSNKFNNFNLLEFADKIMGKFLGTIITMFYTIIFLLANILFVTIFVEVLDVALFPLTPTWFNTVLAFITCAYISYKGLNGLCRFGETVVPIIIGGTFFLVLLGVNNFDFSELLPILSDSSFKDLNLGAMNTSFRFADILILVMITPKLTNKKDLNKIFINSTIYSILMVTILIVATQITLGVEYTKHANFPFLIYTRTISIGEIYGFDSLYIGIWIMGNIMKISAYLYFSTIALEKLTRKNNQVFIIPVSIILIILTIFIKDREPILPIAGRLNAIIQILSIIAIIIVPSIMLIVYYLRRKRLRNT